MSHDLIRLREEYTDRTRRLADSDTYSLFNRAHLFMVQQRQRSVLETLRNEGLFPLTDKRILEVGCGAGGVLLEYLSYGATPSTLIGVDLLLERLLNAHDMLPALPLAYANGQHLPYAENSFDLVMQYTAFSSILDSAVKTQLAQEMLRVVKPDGLILWYDFWINPTNRQTRGIGRREIQVLFPSCKFTFRKVTLAPPITRHLVNASWIICSLLEKLLILNTHYLVGISPQDKSD